MFQNYTDMKKNRPFIQIETAMSGVSYSEIMTQVLRIFPNIEWDNKYIRRPKTVVRLFPDLSKGSCEVFKVYRFLAGFNRLLGGVYRFSLYNLTYEY